MEKYKDMTLTEILDLENGKNRSNKDRFTDKALNASNNCAKIKLLPYLEFGQRIGNMYFLIFKGKD